MAKCRVFTNSVSDITPEIASEYGITVIPDVVIFGDREYQTTIDIDPPKLYQLLRQVDYLPTTSHPNPYIYSTCFETASDYEEILCINVSSRMSGSMNTASLTAATLAEEGFGPKIYTYDSMQVSYGLAYQVIQAAILARQGATAREIMAELDQIRDRVGVYFCMSSLANAKKGGRIGEVKCLAADLMGIRPVLTFRDGTVKELNLTRGFDRALERVAKYYDERAKKGGMVFVCHANNEPEALRMRERVLNTDPDAQVRVEWIGVAIGVYTGEGAIGLIFQE
ncbi:MAG: DegV family protein [Eubacteriales bacterium]|nr:DegV family protein [Eubacteriales bacterium]MDD3109531.1 DegV family protein [Eubacteriales bacterium]MDD3571899.1 DegV family protein [Eubacteriales bacterium]MDD4134421.1 DegV family protein [Eubacteriales bacterium]NLO14201.1 DegV family protein [Clostridiales bacterium]